MVNGAEAEQPGVREAALMRAFEETSEHLHRRLDPDAEMRSFVEMVHEAFKRTIVSAAVRERLLHAACLRNMIANPPETRSGCSSVSADEVLTAIRMMKEFCPGGIDDMPEKVGE